MELLSVKPAVVGEQQYYENLLDIFAPALYEKLDVSQVTLHLVSAGLLRPIEDDEINELARSDRTAAVRKLLNKLRNSNDHHWFHKLKQGLKKSGQHIIFMLLNEDDVEIEDAYEELLCQHYAAIVEDVDPLPLLPELVQKKTITHTDLEVILTEERNHGRRCAVRKLLTMIPSRTNGWFTAFVAALKHANYLPLVNAISPELSSAKSDMSIANAAKKLKGLNMSQKEADVTKEKESRKVVQNNAPETSANAKGLLCDASSFKLKNTFVASAIEGPPLPGTDYRNLDEDPGSIINLMEDDDPVAGGHDDNQSSLCVDGETILSTSREVHTLIRNSNSCGDESLNARCYKTDELQSSFNLNLRSSNSEVHQINQLTKASSQDSAAPRLPSLTESANVFDSSMQEGPIEEIVTKESLTLRGYQKELSEMAIEGKNCVIVAPTGSGKTHVALYISKCHLESSIEEDRKILFFVPKVALVVQQRKQYEKYMDGNCKVSSVSGEAEMPLTLSEIIKKNDVIVMTPQILVNAMEEEGVIDRSFSQVTLMIFDECHHAMKDHPYNNIMSRYIDILISEDMENINRLPQVVGLTASPGVGKAKSDADAIEHILKLCANLAATYICTVKRSENLTELQKYTNVPIEGIEEIKGRTNDKFYDAISKIMGDIESRMRQRTDINQLIAEVPKLQRALVPPSSHGIESYTQYLAQLKREVAKIYKQDTRRFFLSCQEYLEIYNNALLVNADCRTVDAFELIKKKFHEMHTGPRSSLPRDENNEIDRWLKENYKQNEGILQRISLSPDSANPKLTYLEKLILSYYIENKESQGIIFCKTRFMTDALVKWLKETPTLAFLNPHNLVGTGSTAATGSVTMTHRKLDDVLKYFKGGVHKIIVATSVAEEGLDVKSCNYIIRYEHVTNDIARVQSRGRARADDAKYVLIGEKGRGVQQREMTNQVREELMSRAIHLVHKLSCEEVESRIRQQQDIAKKERDMIVEAKAANAAWKASRSHDGEYQLRCFKCDTLGIWHSDLRTIKGSHHVVLDEEFKDRIIVEDHPHPKRYDDFEKKGKVYCKKCGIDWGISALYKSVHVFLLKVCSFVVEDPERLRLTYKKWKEVPFKVEELAPGDMKTLPSVFSSCG